MSSHPFAGAPWGLTLATEPAAARVERLWRLPVLAGLVATVPAFYAGMLGDEPAFYAALAYTAAALLTAAARLHTARRCRHPAAHLRANPADLLLVAGLAAAALLPASHGSTGALAVRLGVSMLVLLRMVWALQHLITRGGLAYLLLLSIALLGLCGIGFWWLEPTAHSFGDGLWLAFTTAATVGYGDVVPTTPAAKIFAVFVVLLGFGVLTTVTAAIAAAWIETEERRIEREILRDLRTQIGALRREIAALRAESRSATQLLAESHEEHTAPAPSKREPM